MPVSDSNIFITGAKGRLGGILTEMLNARGIDKDDLDITDSSAVSKYFTKHAIDTLVHCAAYTDVAGAETNKELCYRINTIGTENLIQHFKGKRFVFISTDYVFSGERGNYKEDDTPDPVNYYARTKFWGELAVRQHPNTLIIRTSFKPDGRWPYPKAFTDLYTSADYLSVIAPMIAEAISMEDLFGVVHIATKKKSVFELAKQQTPEVQPMSINDVDVTLPKNITLNTERWEVTRKSR